MKVNKLSQLLEGNLVKLKVAGTPKDHFWETAYLYHIDDYGNSDSTLYPAYYKNLTNLSNTPGKFTITPTQFKSLKYGQILNGIIRNGEVIEMWLVNDNKKSLPSITTKPKVEID